MKYFFDTAKQILKKNMVSLVLFEVSFRIMLTILLDEAGSRVLRQLLRLQGYSYMTADNFESVLFHPVTVVSILPALLVLLVFFLFECCGILTCFERSWQREEITMPGMIRAGAAGCLRIIRRHPLRWIFFMAGSAPFLSLNLIVWEISRARLAEAVLQKLGERLSLPLLILLAAAVLVLSLRCTFSLPRRLLRSDAPREVRESTRDLLRGKGKWNLAGAVLVQVLVAAVSAVLCVAAAAVMTTAVKIGRNPGSEVSAVLIYGKWIRQTAGAAAGSLGITAGLLYLYTFFAREEKTPFSKPAPRRRGRLLTILSHRRILAAATVLILAAESLFVLILMRGSIPDKTVWDSGVEVTAHRGGARMAPENTLSALKAAVESLADYAEIDVQETSDGEIVLLHDTNLARVTGLNADIWDLTYSEVSQLDAGIKFNKKFRGEKIPTLGEALDYCRGRIRLNIELKYNGHNPDIVPKVVEIIEAYDFADSCVVTSMNYGFLEQIKEICPEITTGYTLTMIYGGLRDMTAADFFSVKHTYLNRRFVTGAHLLGKKVCAWTLNYQGDMQRMIDCGVDNIITDDPELVRRVILGEPDQDLSWLDLLKYALR